MKKAVILDEVNLKEDEEEILKDISLNFYCGVNTFVCGTNSCGKTMLLKAIDKKIKYRGNIIKNVSTIVVFDKSYFVTNTLEEELKYILLNETQKEFVDSFFIKNELNDSPNNLSFYKQKILLLCASLSKNPEILFIDNLFSFLSKKDIKKFMDYFKNNNITVVNFSNNIEEALLYDYMVVLDDGLVAIEGKTNQVLQEEKILKRLGIGLPFYVDLSIQLKLYGLIDGIYLNKKELVDKLWK